MSAARALAARSQSGDTRSVETLLTSALFFVCPLVEDFWQNEPKAGARKRSARGLERSLHSSFEGPLCSPFKDGATLVGEDDGRWPPAPEAIRSARSVTTCFSPPPTFILH